MLIEGRDMGISGKSSKLSTILAALCIAAYIAAIIFASVRIIVNIRERQNIAEREFYDLADRATSSSVFLGFMSEAYQATIRDFLTSSETLLGIIITGSGGESAFERYPGSGIVWAGDSPRFKTGAGFPREPFFLPLGVEGQRNVTIQAVYGIFDYTLFQEVLRQTLLLVLSALIIAFLTLLVELTLKKRAGYFQSVSEPNRSKPSPEPKVPEEPKSPAESKIFGESKNPEEPKVPSDKPRVQSNREEQVQRFDKPKGNIDRESNASDRLNSELHRCAAFEQDLVLLAMELQGSEKAGDIIGDSLFNQFAEEALSFFTMRDLIFAKGENGISVIIPGIDLEQGIAKSEEFRRRIFAKIPELSGIENLPGIRNLSGYELCMGLSSRSGRLMEADRLMLEANSALKRAANSSSRVVAFKSDPDKYREFIKANH